MISFSIIDPSSTQGSSHGAAKILLPPDVTVVHQMEWRRLEKMLEYGDVCGTLPSTRLARVRRHKEGQSKKKEKKVNVCLQYRSTAKSRNRTKEKKRGMRNNKNNDNNQRGPIPSQQDQTTQSDNKKRCSRSDCVNM